MTEKETDPVEAVGRIAARGAKAAGKLAANQTKAGGAAAGREATKRNNLIDKAVAKIADREEATGERSEAFPD